MDSVKVAVRCRPFSNKEKKAGAQPVVHIDGRTVTLTPPQTSTTALGEKNRGTPLSSKTYSRTCATKFEFDHCFGPESTQKEIFKAVGSSVIENALEGFNTSVFGYGQTSSGKTFTMLGDKSSRTNAGIIPRIVKTLLHRVAADQEAKARYSLGGMSAIIFDDEGSDASDSESSCESSSSDSDNDSDSDSDDGYDSQNMEEKEHDRPPRSLSIGGTSFKDEKVLYKLEASYYEIYNEQCKDLLSGATSSSYDAGKHKSKSSGGGSGGSSSVPQLKVREHQVHGPFLQGLSTTSICKMEDIDQVLTRGAAARSVESTESNEASSRSHAVFTLVFTQTRIAPDISKAIDTVSRINLIDLAGSEKTKVSKVEGSRMTEAQHINKSLLALSRVIKALSKSPAEAGGGNKENSAAASPMQLTASQTPNKGTPQKKRGEELVVPYRDSVLTYLLKPCLGGNSKTTMLATVSPADINFEETLSTLRYAAQCSNIKTSAVINRDPNDQVIIQLRVQVEQLQQKLANQIPRIMNGESVAELQRVIMDQKRDLDEETLRHRKTQEMRAQEQQSHYAKLELLETRLETERAEVVQQHDQTRDRLVQTQAELQATKEELAVVQAELAAIKQQTGDQTSQARSLSAKEKDVRTKMEELESKLSKHDIYCKNQIQEIEKLKKTTHEELAAAREGFEREREIRQLRWEGQEAEMQRREKDLEVERDEFKQQSELIMAQHERAKEQAEFKITQLNELTTMHEANVKLLDEQKAELEASKEDLIAREKAVEHIKNSVQENEALKEELDTVRETLVANDAAHSESMDALQRENASLKQAHEESIQKIVAEHETKLADQRSDFDGQLAQQIEKRDQGMALIVEQHSKEFMQLVNSHAEELGEIKSEHAEQLAAVQRKLDDECERTSRTAEKLKGLAQDHHQNMSDIHNQHDEEVLALHQSHAEAINSLKAKHLAEMETAKASATEELIAAQNELEAKHDEAMEATVATHKTELDLLKEEWTAKLEATSGATASEVAELRAAHDEAIKETTESHVVERTALIAKHEQALQTERETHAEALETLRVDHTQALEEAIDEKERQIASLENGHTETIQTMGEMYKEEMDKLKQQLASQLEATEQLVKEKDELIQSLRAEKDALVGQSSETQQEMTRTHEEALEKLQAESNATIEALKVDFSTSKETLEKEHAETIESMSTLYADQLEKVKSELSEEKIAHQATEQQHEEAVAELKQSLEKELAHAGAAHEEEANKLRATMERNQSQMEEKMVAEINQYEERLCNMNNSMVQECERLESEKVALETELRDKITSLQDQNDELQGDLEEATSQVSELQGNVQELTKQSEDLAERGTNELIALTMKHKEHNTSMQGNYEKEIAKREKEIQVLTLNHGFKVAELTKEHDSKVEEITSAHDEVVGNLNRKITAQQEAWEEEVESVKASHEQQVAELTSTWDEERASMIKERDELVASHEGNMASTLAEHEAVKQNLEESMAKQAAAHEASSSELELRLMKEMREKEEALTAKLEEKTEECVLTIKDMESRSQAFEFEKEELMNHIGMIEDDLKMLQEQHERTMEEHNEEYTRLATETEAEQTRMVEEHTCEIKSRDNSIKDLESELVEARTENDNMVERYEEMVKEMQQELEQIREEHDALGADHEELSHMYQQKDDQLNAEHQTWATEKRALQRHLVESKNIIKELSENLERLTNSQEKSEEQMKKVERHMLEQQSKQASDEMRSFQEWLMSGIVILKHPRNGQPSARLMWISRNGRNGGYKLNFGKLGPNIWSSVGKSSEKGINIVDIMEIREGQRTKVFERTKKLTEMSGMTTPDNICLSLICRERTIDIECKTPHQRNRLLKGFRDILAIHKQSLCDTIDTMDFDDYDDELESVTNMSVIDRARVGSAASISTLGNRSTVSYKSNAYATPPMSRARLPSSASISKSSGLRNYASSTRTPGSGPGSSGLRPKSEQR